MRLLCDIKEKLTMRLRSQYPKHTHTYCSVPSTLSIREFYFVTDKSSDSLVFTQVLGTMGTANGLSCGYIKEENL